jgi:hypothetical protein
MAILNGTATLTGVGNISATSRNHAVGTAVIAGAGNFAVMTPTTQLLAGSAVLAGVGNAVAPTRAILQATSILQGQGTVSPVTRWTAQAKAFIVGQGGLFAGVVRPVVTAVTPAPPPVVLPIDTYLDRIPSYNASQPDFMAVLSAVLQPVVDLQALLKTMPQQFDLDTAIGAQLDVDGIWIGRDRFVNTPLEGVYFSWDIDGLGWEEGTWQGAFDPDAGTNRLDDETYRQVLYAKVGSNHWDGTITGIVNVLHKLFGSQGVTITVTDNMDMSLTVTVNGAINSAVFKALLVGGYIPIKPEGVSINFVLS